MISARSRAVSALGVIEIFAWGSTYYLMAVLAEPIARDTGWSVGVLSAGISVGLLVSGLAAPKVGSLIQATDGRHVLAIGMSLIVIGLILLGSARSLPVYFAAWTVLGLGMSAGLYDAAFSTLGRLYGKDARSAITQLTLWGGFASTVCWPITAWLEGSLGWRGTCFAYAGLHLAVTLPMALLALPRTQPADGAPAPVPSPNRDEAPSLLDPRFLCIVTAGIMLTLLATIWSVHLITILKAEGYALAAAIALGTLIGPAQVGARVLELLGGGRHHPIWTMIAATTLVLLGFVGLRLGITASAALIAYGAGNGLWSIARGALPLELFGPVRYARNMGVIAMPILIAGAAAPVVGAALIDVLGPRGTLTVLAIGSALPFAAAIVLWSMINRDRKLLSAAAKSG
jgi:predicted MFS family arabinose efflux permease